MANKYKIGDVIIDGKRNLTILEEFYKSKTRWRTKEHISKYTINEKYYKIKCNKCGFDNLEISKNNLDKGEGCSCCRGFKVVVGINDITTTDPWMVPFFQGGAEEAKKYTHGSGKRIYPICPICGKIKNMTMQINTIHRLHSIACSCYDGIPYPEKFLISILKQNNISYIYQLSKATFEWCDKYRYDFYLPDHNYIIETHGIQHYEESTLTARSLLEEKQNDKHKKDLAIKNGIKKFFCIDCRYSYSQYIVDRIKEINELHDLLNIDNIDIKQCEIDSINNKLKEVCQIKNNNPDYTSTIIGEITGLNRSTVKNYLKRGSVIGLCNYDPKKEKTERSRKIGKNSAYEINVIDKSTNEILGTYRSVKELQNNSLADFGFKSSKEPLRKAAKYNKIYKGYIIKYTKDLMEAS